MTMKKKKFKKCRTGTDIRNDPRIGDLFRGTRNDLLHRSNSDRRIRRLLQRHMKGHLRLSKWYAVLKWGFWLPELGTSIISANTLEEVCFYLNEQVEADELEPILAEVGYYEEGR